MSTVRLTRRLCDRVPMDERNTFAYRKKLQNQKRELRRREKRNKQKSEREAQLQLSAAQNAVVDAVSREAVVQSQNATQLIDLPVDFPVIEANGQQITVEVSTNAVQVVAPAQKKRTWESRVKDVGDKWDESRDDICRDFIRTRKLSQSMCESCRMLVINRCIRCLTCKLSLCPRCDATVHVLHPFHQREIMRGSELAKMVSSEFIDPSSGQLIQRDVPVPCFPPEHCSKCMEQGTVRRMPGKKNMIVVNLDGRFDLKTARFVCKSCNHSSEATIKDYINSSYWPATLERLGCLYSFSLLNWWYNLSHIKNAPRTTKRKFIKTLATISAENSRNACINRNVFFAAYKEFEIFKQKVQTGIVVEVDTAAAVIENPPETIIQVQGETAAL